MFNEPSQPLHPTHPDLSSARIYSSFLEDGENFACVLVLPGGGYGMVSHQEGPPVAGWLNSMGISAMVLEYDVGEKVYPKPQQQALYAMRYLRANAKRLNIDPQRIGVIGFSAGGHLSACVSHGFEQKDWLLDPDETFEGISARPDLSILAYPVISSAHFPHQGSFINLLGDDATPAEREKLSWEKHIHPNSPPTFLWHTAEDDCVPVENTYLMAMGLSSKNIPHEVHVYPQGHHGLGLCSIGDRRQGACTQWKQQAERWLMDQGF